MTYTEMQQAEAAYLEALRVQKRIQPKQRSATKAQLEYRRRWLGLKLFRVTP